MQNDKQRDVKDYAIEHAGYLADAVERVLQHRAFMIDNEADWYVHEIESEDWRTLERLVYEFRKRAKRVEAIEEGMRVLRQAWVAKDD